MKTASIFTFIILTTLSFSPPPSSASRHNFTEQLEYIGNPYITYYPNPPQIYARNIWDMIEFKGKIYFGGGNSANVGPIPNAGPVPIRSYNPKNSVFSTSFMTSEEQIDRFYTFGATLYVPGNDPRQNWNRGNLYRTKNGKKWQKKRTIPFAIHALCLTSLNGQLFAGLGTANGAGIAISDTWGDYWQFNLFPNSIRFYEFLTVNNRLYAIGTLVPEKQFTAFVLNRTQPLTQVVEYTSNNLFTPRHDITINDLLPDTTINVTNINPYKIAHPQSLKNKAVYIGGKLHNSMQTTPFGLYRAESLEKGSISVKKINLPHDGIPWDTYRSGDYVYVLTNKEIEDQIEVVIFRSKNLENWEELFYFNTEQPVRSFVFTAGTFYFSLGCEVNNPQKWTQDELGTHTGDIFKITLYSIP